MTLGQNLTAWLSVLRNGIRAQGNIPQIDWRQSKRSLGRPKVEEGSKNIDRVTMTPGYPKSFFISVPFFPSNQMSERKVR